MSQNCHRIVTGLSLCLLKAVSENNHIACIAASNDGAADGSV
jgi:hypothetical protein